MPMSTNALAATDAAQSMQVHMHEWLVLGGLVVALIGMDLFLHLRKPHEPTIKECTRWLVFYVGLAVVFGVYTWFRHSSKFAFEYFATYFTEYSLSIDNIFIFIIIIGSFRVPRKYQQKVLLWGIVIALVLRLVFILLGATLLKSFSWLFFIFAAFLLWTAWNQLREGVEDRKDPDHDDDEYKPNAVVRGARKIFLVTDGFVGDKMMVRRNHKTFVTPFFLCIISIGSADLMFALDSIPASFGLTSQPFIIFAANAFALMGLRQLFFLVEGLLERLVYLHYGLAAILAFIGFKLLVEACHGQGWLEFMPDIHPLVSLAAILVILVLTVVTSLGKTKRDTIEGTNVEEAGDEIEAGRVAQAFRERQAFLEGSDPSGAQESADRRQPEEAQRSGGKRQHGNAQRSGNSLSGRKGPLNTKKKPRNWG